MKYVLIVISLIMVHSAFAQKTDIRLNESKSEQGVLCYDAELNYTGDEASLASQNYRIFYDASTLKFDEEHSHLTTVSEDYTFNVVQQNHGIDASGIGSLAFEKELGFINATVLFKDPRLAGQKLKEGQGWTSIVRFCFESSGEQSDKQVILARKELTASYGRAFVELSIVDQSDAITSLPIASYTDIK